jgi:hypothetical protein
MKRFLLVFLFTLMFTLPVFAGVDKASEEYLKGKKHYSLITPLTENFVQKILKNSLKQGKNGKFETKFVGYSFYSLRKGVFKHLEIIGRDVDVDEMVIPYLKVATVSDYNKIDYRKKPIVVMSDIDCVFDIHLTEQNINTALQNPKYKKKIEKINKLAYPLFSVNNLIIKIKDDRMYFIIN